MPPILRIYSRYFNERETMAPRLSLNPGKEIRHSVVAEARLTIAQIYCEADDFLAEESILRSGVNTERGESSATVGTILQRLAELAFRRGDIEAALSTAIEAAEARHQALSSESPKYQETVRTVVKFYSCLGDEEETDVWNEFLSVPIDPQLRQEWHKSIWREQFEHINIRKIVVREILENFLEEMNSVPTSAVVPRNGLIIE
jgi:hypothetical protein